MTVAGIALILLSLTTWLWVPGGVVVSASVAFLFGMAGGALTVAGRVH